MSEFRRISSQDQTLLDEVESAALDAGLNPEHPAQVRNGPIPTDLIIALGSAGTFTALYKIVSSMLTKNKDRELHIEAKGVKLTIKGHNLPEEKELLKLIAPTLASLPDPDKKHKDA